MLLTLSGPSAVGKDSTWVRIAETLGFSREVPFTSRHMRTGEIDHRDYHFVNKEEFQRLIRDNKLTEWDYALGNYYGTAISLRERLMSGENIVMQVLGRMALRLKRSFPQTHTIILATSEIETLEQRLIQRGYTCDELRQRVLHGLEELTHAPLFDLVVPDADIMTDFDVTRILQDISISQ